MNDDPVIVTLHRALHTQARGHHLNPGMAATAWTDAQAARPHRILIGLAAASVIAVVGGAATVALIHPQDTATSPTGSSICSGNVSTATLPTWAQAGFDPAGMHTPHVLGTHAEIVAILFGDLRAHQPAGTNNKILWVARDGYGTLRITARLEGSDATAIRTVDLGPSIVNLPAPGCWQMTLTWSGHSDTIAMRYQR